MDYLGIQGLAGSLRTSNYLVPVLTESERLFKEDDSPNFYTNRFHCCDQYYHMDWMQGKCISKSPHAHIYSVFLWDKNKYY